MNKQIKKQWIKALRSGKYKQGTRQLRSSDNSFCCLGVLCNLHAQAHPEIAATQHAWHTYLGEYSLLPAPVAEWAGITSGRAGGLKKEICVNGYWAPSLAALNDEGASFNEIADIIEEQF